MSTVPFYSSPRARFFDSNGKPLSNGRVSFYFANTSTFKEVYTDASGTTLAQNPQLLDSEGYVRDGGVWLGSGTYKVVLDGSDGAGGYVEEWSMDDIPGADLVPAGEVGNVTYVRTVADMVTLPVNTYGAVYVFGYYEENDGGQGWFLWDETSSDIPDDGYIFAPSGVPTQGRWYRNFEDDHISVTQWGATQTASGAVNANLTKCIQYANSNDALHRHITVPTGVYELNGNTLFYGDDVSVTFEAGASFTANSSYSLQIVCGDADVDGLTSLVDSNVLLTWAPISNRDAHAEYWGAGVTVSGLDDRRAMGRIDCRGKVIFSGNYSATPLVGQPFPLSVDRAHFKRGCSFIISSNFPIITFNDITYDNNAEGVFQSTNGHYNTLRFSNREIPIKLFNDNVLSNNTYYENFIISITDNNNKSGIILWDSVDTITSTVTYTNVDWKLQSKFLNGCILKTQAPLFIGTNISGPVHCFDTSSTDTPILKGNSFLLQWWNPSQVDDSTINPNTNIALITAHNTQVNAANFTGSYAAIDGLGGYFYYDTQIEIPATGRPFQIKNIELIQSIWQGAISEGVIINTNVIADNCLFYTNAQQWFVFSNDDSKFNNCVFNNTDTNFSRVFNFGNSLTDYNGSITFNNCQFEAPNQQVGVLTFFNPIKVLMNNCIADRATPFVSFGDRVKGYVNGCNFEGEMNVSPMNGRWQCSNTAFIGGPVEVTANENDEGVTSFDGCSFDKQITIRTSGANNITDLKITNCFFKNSNSFQVPRIIFLSDATGTKICNGVMITNNIFDYQGITINNPWDGEIIRIGVKNTTPGADYGQYIESIGGGSSNFIALTGHFRCLVANNICRGDAVYVGTDQNYQLRINSSSTDDQFLLSNPYEQRFSTYTVLIRGATEAILIADVLPMYANVYGRKLISTPAPATFVDNFVNSSGVSIFRKELLTVPTAVINYQANQRANFSQMVKVEWNNASTEQNPNWIYVPS